MVQDRYPIIRPPDGSVVVFKISLEDSEEWLELDRHGALIHHYENAGARMFLRRGTEEKSIPISSDEAKRRWPKFAAEIERALATRTAP